MEYQIKFTCLWWRKSHKVIRLPCCWPVGAIYCTVLLDRSKSGWTEYVTQQRNNFIQSASFDVCLFLLLQPVNHHHCERKADRSCDCRSICQAERVSRPKENQNTSSRKKRRKTPIKQCKDEMMMMSQGGRNYTRP